MPDFKAPYGEHWRRISHKPKFFPPEPHETHWNDVVGVPSVFSATAHTHPVSEITDFPAKWDWADLTNVPASFPPAAHSHGWGSITGKPAQFPPEAHTHVVADITDFPATWDWNALTNVPASFSPSSHVHAIADITGLEDALEALEPEPFTVEPATARPASFGTAYQTSATKPSFISAMIDVAYTVTVAGTSADTVELRVGANQAQVAAGTGGIVAATFRAALTGVTLSIGLAMGRRGQLAAIVPAGHYWALRRTQGSAATIQSVMEQELG